MCLSEQFIGLEHSHLVDSVENNQDSLLKGTNDAYASLVDALVQGFPEISRVEEER